MLKAGSLFYTVAIALIMGMISSALILFSYFNTLGFHSYLELEKLRLNAGSALNLLLSEQAMIKKGEVQLMDLYDQGTDSVLLEKRPWGACEIVISKAFSKNREVTHVAQVGFPLSTEQVALYLVDYDKGLSLCGNTKIRGTSYLPKAGVKRAYIEGQSFAGEKLVDGIIKESAKRLPAINEELYLHITDHLSGIFSENDSILTWEEVEERDSLSWSFEKKSLYVHAQGQIQLNKPLSGNIAIVSDKMIRITADAVLKDILIYAPRIEIDEAFTGNIQAFASDTLLVGKKAILRYPSILGLVRTAKSPAYPALIVKEGAEVSGVLFAYQENTDFQKEVSIALDKETTVRGQVYSSGIADIKGSIYGNLTCSRIMLVTPSSVYENHLLNATIDHTKLSGHFAGIGLVAQTTSKKIMKWLY